LPSFSVHLPPAEPTNPTTQLDDNLIDIDFVPELTNPTTSTTVTGGVYASTAVPPSDALPGSSGPVLVEGLHPTNPFLQDIAGPQAASQQPPPYYQLVA
uniref:RELA n=1 Tax=Nippostrongylus brasiliensis TaxID=27835 RepID=A0A0N4YLL9_NIPBR